MTMRRDMESGQGSEFRVQNTEHQNGESRERQALDPDLSSKVEEQHFGRLVGRQLEALLVGHGGDISLVEALTV